MFLSTEDFFSEFGTSGVMEADGSLSSVTGECSGDDDPERFLAERLSLNVGRTPGAMQFWRRFQMVEST